MTSSIVEPDPYAAVPCSSRSKRGKKAHGDPIPQVSLRRSFAKKFEGSPNFEVSTKKFAFTCGCERQKPAAGTNLGIIITHAQCIFVRVFFVAFFPALSATGLPPGVGCPGAIRYNLLRERVGMPLRFASQGRSIEQTNTPVSNSSASPPFDSMSRLPARAPSRHTSLWATV